MNLNSRTRRPATFSALLTLRCPADVRDLLDAEATRRRCTPSELARRLILAGISAEGLALPDPFRP